MSISTQFLPRVQLINHQLWIIQLIYQLIYHLYSQSASSSSKFIIVQSLDANKAAGINGTDPRFLKQCAGSITPLVYHLLNLCIVYILYL